MDENKSQLINSDSAVRWFRGAPLVVCGVNLYKNFDSDELFANIRFVNIQPEKLESITIDIICYGIIRNEIERIENYTYEHLNIERNECFGDITFIKIENPETMSVDIVLKSAVDSDGEEWINDNLQPFDITLKQNSISSYMGRYFDKFKDLWVKKGLEGERLIYAPSIQNDYWLCVCGTFNWTVEKKCCKCGAELSWLEENTDVSALRKEEDFSKPLNESEKTENPIAFSKKVSEQSSRSSSDFNSKTKGIFSHKHKKKTKKITAFFVSLVGLAVIAVLIYYFLTPASNYYNAVSLINHGEYDQAIKALESLNGYNDSKEQIYRAKYLKAESLQTAENYLKASEIFKDLKNYSDSTQKYKECMYQYAEKKYSDKQYIEALKIFTSLGDYEDSAKKADKAEKTALNEASKLLDDKKYSEASSEFLEIYNITKNPDAIEQSNSALLKRADELYGQYKYVEAIQIYESLSGYDHVDVTLKKLDSLRKILSTSIHMKSDSSVWECDGNFCDICHMPKALSYKFTFNADGEYEFIRQCPNHSGKLVNKTLTGKYKIENDIIYSLTDDGNSAKWTKLASIENITSNSTNSNKNAKLVVTNPFEKKGSPLILYGNIVDEKSSPI